MDKNKKILNRLFPFLNWVGELKDIKILRADILAGITLSLVLIPQSMANAQLADLPPYYGFYASFVPIMVGALFGSSRQLSTGPVALVALMTAAVLGPLAGSEEEYIGLAIMLALLVGLFQFGLGLLRLGTLVNFLSHPVVLGFTNAAAIIISTSQIDKLFGVTVARGGPHYERMWRMWETISAGFHTPTLVMGVSGIVVLIVLRRISQKIPNVLVVALSSTVIAWWIGFEEYYGGLVVGNIPEGIPSFALPIIDWGMLPRMLSATITISLIGYMETISIAKAIATQTRQRIDANQELLAQGLSNIAGSFFRSFPVSGSFVRSAVTLRAGGQTGFASVVAGVVVILMLLFFTPMLYHMPLAILAAIVMVSVTSLLHISPIKRAWQVHRHDGIVAVATFVLTLISAPHLDVGIAVGVGLSLGLYLYRTMKPRVAVLSRHPDGALRDAEVHKLDACEIMAMVRFDGSLYFGSTGAFEDTMLTCAAQNPHLRYLIIDAEGINQVDATGEEMLLGLVRRLKEAKVEVFFGRAKKQVLDALERPGTLDEIGRERFFATPDQAMQAVWAKLDGSFSCHHQCPGECPLHRAKPKGAVFYRV
ncbi:MAG: sulfate permease [Candidatus Latescibacteria bacterium]|nr:sulfate permease [Candidatus Latescibacterota bacterium]